jgi:hypothetical protein
MIKLFFVICAVLISSLCYSSGCLIPVSTKSADDWRESNSNLIFIGKLVGSRVTEEIKKEDGEVWNIISIESEFLVESVLKGDGKAGNNLVIIEKFSCQDCSSSRSIKNMKKFEGERVKVFLEKNGQAYRFNECFTSIELQASQ